MQKQEMIDKLTEAGVTFNKRASNADLRILISELDEVEEIIDIEDIKVDKPIINLEDIEKQNDTPPKPEEVKVVKPKYSGIRSTSEGYITEDGKSFQGVHEAAKHNGTL